MEFRASIKIDKGKWLKFKKIAKYKNSDASKEIRKFIDEYIVKNNQLFLDVKFNTK